MSEPSRASFTLPFCRKGEKNQKSWSLVSMNNASQWVKSVITLVREIYFFIDHRCDLSLLRLKKCLFHPYGIPKFIRSRQSIEFWYSPTYQVPLVVLHTPIKILCRQLNIGTNCSSSFSPLKGHRISNYRTTGARKISHLIIGVYFVYYLILYWVYCNTLSLTLRTNTASVVLLAEYRHV